MRAAYLSVILALGVRAQVPLNHFYVTVDPESYRAIESAPELKDEFAVFEKRTTVRRDRTYTGVYFYGLHTYFEFFESGGHHSPTHSGIAFGVEQPGRLEAMQREWTAAKHPGILETITREWQGQAIPWFVSLTPQPSAPPSVLRTWLMEYIPAFAESWHSEFEARPTVLRKDILSLYKQVLKPTPTTRLLEDVTGLSVALPPQEKAELLSAASQMGCPVEADRVRCSGIDILVMPSSPERTGIVEMRATLTREIPIQKEIQLGRSRLVLRSNKTAVWTF